MKNYLMSSEAVADYAKLANKYAGNRGKDENSRAIAFRKAWRENLEDNDVILEDLNEDDILPKKIYDKIESAIKDSVIIKHFNPAYNIASDGYIFIEDEENADGAWAHTPLANKKMQQTELKDRMMIPRAIYKLQRLDHMTWLKGGELVNWVLTELPAYVVERLEQQILVGGAKYEDGSIMDGSNGGVRPILNDPLAFKHTLTSATPDRNELFQSILEVISEVAGKDEDKILFIDPKAYATLVAGGDSLAVAMMVGQVDFGAGTMEKTSLIRRGVGTGSGAVDAIPFIVVNPRYYKLGFAASGIETLSDFEIMQNAQVVESRAYVAGSMSKLNGAGYAVHTIA